MPDPIANPTTTSFEEDIVHPDTSPRIGMQPSRKAEQAEAFQRRKDREYNELSKVLSTDEGQAVILRILEQCHVYAENHLSDEAQGRRILGVRLIKEICALSPDSYPNLLINHAKRQQRIKDADDAINANNA
jgi:hypothetical protein